MDLRALQSLFVKCLGRLLQYADAQGYEFTIGESYRPDHQGHMPNSLHYVRLAIDLNLFVNGVYIADGKHKVWQELATFWKKLDPLCAAGYDFGDSNHFSVRFGGRQ